MRSIRLRTLSVASLAFLSLACAAARAEPALDADLAGIEPKVIEWRRDIHRHPELGNREFRTAALVAKHLESLGLDVHKGVGGTGVVGVLQGAKPGRVVALRADMDALPVKEETGLPFASTATSEYNGRTVPVMHACGHDAHTAMLMGAAEVLAKRRDEIAGTVMFIFQPAEEGAPEGEEGGATRMIAEGVFRDLRPEAIFALHVEPGAPGRIDVRAGPFLSSATSLRIDLAGRQTHAGRPWEGTDLVNLAADIVKGLATISSRQVDVFDYPNVVSIASVQAGVRGNILPGEATLLGTIRTFDAGRLEQLKQLIRIRVDSLAKAYDATATVTFTEAALVTGSDPELLGILLPALERAAGAAGVDTHARLRGAAEDFSYFEREIPGVYYILGSTPGYTAMETAPTNHSPRFDIDESVLVTGVKAHVLTTLRFLGSDFRKSN